MSLTLPHMDLITTPRPMVWHLILFKYRGITWPFFWNWYLLVGMQLPLQTLYKFHLQGYFHHQVILSSSILEALNSEYNLNLSSFL